MDENHILEVKGVHAPKTQLGFTKFHTLLEAAETLFTRNSFYDVSVSDICKEAHTAVGTFYIYFDGKTDIYRYLLARYKLQIRTTLAQAIRGCTTRLEKEREGIKAFIRYSVYNPSVYNIIWGSLAVDKQMFEEYYAGFAASYARALDDDPSELSSRDTSTLAYMLMGMTNFLGLKAQFENLDEMSIERMIDETIVPVLETGMFR